MTNLLPSEERLRPLVRRIVLVLDKSPWIVNSVGTVLALMVGAATALDSIPGRNWLTVLWVMALIIAVALMVLGPRMLSRRATRVLDLEERISQLQELVASTERTREREFDDLRKSIGSAGHALLEQCKLNTDDTRISIYQWHRRNNQFVLVGRVSINPALEKAGRPSYRGDSGLIANAWQHERAYHKEWAKEPQNWIASQVGKFGLTEDDAAQIKMQSRSLLGVRIDDDRSPVGVMMFESTDRERVAASHEDTVRSHSAFVRLQALLRAAPRIPPFSG